MKDGNPIVLPSFTKEHEYEEYIAAVIHSCSKSYIERNITERKTVEILELDIIQYLFSDPDNPIINLIEIKSGDWGFPDIFKVKGWQHYLEIPNCIFISEKPKENIDFIEEKTKQIGISLINIPDQNEPQKLLSHYDANELNIEDVNNWRFSFWMERNILKLLNHKKKSEKSKKCYKSMSDYFYNINSALFYSGNVIDIIYYLYRNFQNNPYLTAKVGHEMIGGCFEENHESLPEKSFQDTYYNGQLTDIIISTYLEHRSRLAILKNAIELCIHKKNNNFSKISELITAGDFHFNRMSLLPTDFMERLETIIQTHEYAHLYPCFWQWFMWYFGGIILNDYQDQEYELFSLKTGIPIYEIENALSVYDALFPTRNGWFKTCNNSNIKFLSLFPTPFMGLGSYVRKHHYTSNSTYDELRVTGTYTLSDLRRWHNTGYELLSKTY